MGFRRLFVFTGFGLFFERAAKNFMESMEGLEISQFSGFNDFFHAMIAGNKDRIRFLHGCGCRLCLYATLP